MVTLPIHLNSIPYFRCRATGGYEHTEFPAKSGCRSAFGTDGAKADKSFVTKITSARARINLYQKHKGDKILMSLTRLKTIAQQELLLSHNSVTSIERCHRIA